MAGEAGGSELVRVVALLGAAVVAVPLFKRAGLGRARLSRGGAGDAALRGFGACAGKSSVSGSLGEEHGSNAHTQASIPLNCVNHRKDISRQTVNLHRYLACVWQYFSWLLRVYCL